MKKAVVTMCIGDKWDTLKNLTFPTISDYAKRIGADFIVIDQAIIHPQEVGFEKFQMFKILSYYDRIIYLDADLIVTKKCPDLFDIVPEDEIGAFIESDYWMYSEDVDHRQRMVEVQKVLGNIGWNKDYINTGVLVLSKRHKWIFDLSQNQKCVIDLREQTQLNYNIKKLGYWVYNIGMRFNKMDFCNPLDRFDAYIIHYAGKGFTPEWHNMELKLNRISSDLEQLMLLEQQEKEI